MQASPSEEHHSPGAFAQDALKGFDCQPRTRVLFGPGKLSVLGEVCRETGGNRVLLVTDHGLESAGHVQHALEFMRTAGLEITLFDEVHPNPTTDDVARGLQAARDGKIDLIVGLGGGSSMDCAKGVNFLLTNGGKMEDYWGIGKARLPMLPMVAVPTTAGTGSEAQSYALIAQVASHIKMACGDPKAACRAAILDPEVTLSMPASVTAATGVDALSHAVESFVTTRRSPLSQMYSLESWRRLAGSFSTVLQNPLDLVARSRMLFGAHLAGAAIENSMLGATHALVNPLSARYGTTHGVAIGVMLPHVVRYNSEAVGSSYGILAAEAGLCAKDDPQAGERLADFLQQLVRSSGQPTCLGECDVKADDLPELAQEAAKQWTGTFNPRPVTADSLQQLYAEAM